MKNKEEIESIKKEIKALEDRIYVLEKQTDKEGAKERLWEMFSSCSPRKEEGINSLFFDRDGKTLFEADFKNGIFWVEYSLVWKVSESEYGYNYDQIRDLCLEMVENVLKWKGLTPIYRQYSVDHLVENVLKWIQ